MNVTVLVLGDVGRSPRMQYHCVSLADDESVARVDLVGYEGAALCDALAERQWPRGKVHVRYVRAAGEASAGAAAGGGLGFLWRIVVKIMSQLYALLYALLLSSAAREVRMHSLLVQSPPAIPTLAVAWLVCALRGARFVIDWHNYGFAMLEVSFRERAAEHARLLAKKASSHEEQTERSNRLRRSRDEADDVDDSDDSANDGSLSDDDRYAHTEDEYDEDVHGIDVRTIQLSRMRRLILRLAHWYEGAFAWRAHSHLCVTRALRRDLHARFGIGGKRHHSSRNHSNHRHQHVAAAASSSAAARVHVLHDAPPLAFRSLYDEPRTAHALFVRLRESLQAQAEEHWPHAAATWFKFTRTSTPFTRAPGVWLGGWGNGSGSGSDRRRVALLCTSTSWSADEDFGLLVRAVRRLDALIEAQQSALRVALVITGRGERRAHFMRRFVAARTKHVLVFSAWLEPGDYPLLLGAATLGISLHASAASVDLPMKVVDMFGAHLPVCALRFSCVHELVHDGLNGLLFDTSDELAHQIYDLLNSYPDQCNRLDAMRAYLRDNDTLRWSENWVKHARRGVLGNNVPSHTSASERVEGSTGDDDYDNDDYDNDDTDDDGDTTDEDDEYYEESISSSDE